MNARHFVLLAATTAGIAGCDHKDQSKTDTVASATPTVTPSSVASALASALTLPIASVVPAVASAMAPATVAVENDGMAEEDYEAQAQAEITDSNMDAELSKLEKEINE